MGSEELRKTPLNEAIRRSGAKCVDFAGWEMPVQFTSLIEEHLAVRTSAGLFDVSHMGEIAVEGRDSLSLLQRLTPNDVARLETGQAQYTALLTPRATFVDDVLVYRLGGDRFLLCVNAANREKDFSWIREHATGDLKVEDVSDRYAQLALQGPRAEEFLARVAETPVDRIGTYRFAEGRVRGVPALISRTGYTGEDGYELYVPPDGAERVWTALLEAGRADGLIPAGLGARDTLRLEARMPLYGNDIDETVTPFEAGLGFIVRLEKGEFLGSDVLREQKEKGFSRKLAGFELTGRGIARHGHAVRISGEEAGRVTSGTFAPFLKRSIGLAYLPTGSSAVGQAIEVVVRERTIPGRIVKTPFYKRQA